MTDLISESFNLTGIKWNKNHILTKKGRGFLINKSIWQGEFTDRDSLRKDIKTTVAIIGGGMAGTELAIYLNELGRESAVAEMADKLNFATNTCHASAVNEQLTARGISVYTGAKVIAVKDGCVECETADGVITLEADSVVNALGRTPLQEEASAYALCAPIFYPIGDCLAVKNIYEANRLGYNVAMDIGK